MIQQIPVIFIIVFFGVFSFFILCTLIGSTLVSAHLKQLDKPIEVFLSPALGLAILTIFASYLGRFGPISVSPLLYFIILIGTILSFFKIKKSGAFRALCYGAFCTVAGLSFLAPLFAFGGYNTHNDTFTYLAHSNWLQLYSFGTTLSHKEVTPVSSQIFIYQALGLRMGGSYLLALIQSIYGLNWSFLAYPILAIVCLGATCLSMGLVAYSSLMKIPIFYRYILLLLPSLSLGGIVFSTNVGFIPQGLGICLGASGIFLIGYSINIISENILSKIDLFRLSTLTSLLLTGSVFAYTEFAIFLAVAIILTFSWIYFKYKFSKINLILYLIFLICEIVLLLNVEIIRVIPGLIVQSTAVVGSGVSWPFYGYVAHAFGIHGGAWDVMQWSQVSDSYKYNQYFGVSLLLLIIVLLVTQFKSIFIKINNGLLFPSIVMLALLFFGFIYFRYFSISPLDGFQGKTWSQFKLSDWAHPFVGIFLLIALIGIQSKFPKIFNAILTACVFALILATCWWGVQRTKPAMDEYSGTKNQFKLMLGFREKVLELCPNNSAIYFDFLDSQQKIRQLAAYYLQDRNLKSNWLSDGYISHHLSEENKTTTPAAGDCIISIGNSVKSSMHTGEQYGPFIIGIFTGLEKNYPISADGAHSKESDGLSYWYWVKSNATFVFNNNKFSLGTGYTEVSLEYIALGREDIKIQINFRDGKNKIFKIKPTNNELNIWDIKISTQPSDIVNVIVSTDGLPYILSKSDSREAAFMVRNIFIKPINY